MSERLETLKYTITVEGETEQWYCERCFEKYQKLTPAEHVHHITPLSEGGTHDFDNLMSLCQSCHSRIHAERGDYWRKPI